MILYKKDELIYIEDSEKNILGRWIPYTNFTYRKISSTVIKIVAWEFHGNDYKNFINNNYLASTITNRFSVQYGTTPEDVIFGFNQGTDVHNKDRIEDLIIVKFNNLTNRTTLASAGAIDDKTITLTSPTGTTDGKYVILFDPDSERFSTFNQVGAAVGNVIILDSRLDFDYPEGTFVDLANTNMAVDGSITPVTFGLRGTDSPPGVDITFMLTRMIFTSLTVSAVSLAEFADIPALTNGIFFRSRNDRNKNVTNVKTNSDLANIMFDWTPFAATNPVQGQDGFVSRITLTRIGSTMELPLGDDAEWIVQDALDAVTLYEIVAEGYIKKKI